MVGIPGTIFLHPVCLLSSVICVFSLENLRISLLSRAFSFPEGGTSGEGFLMSRPWCSPDLVRKLLSRSLDFFLLSLPFLRCLSGARLAGWQAPTPGPLRISSLLLRVILLSASGEGSSFKLLLLCEFQNTLASFSFLAVAREQPIVSGPRRTRGHPASRYWLRPPVQASCVQCPAPASLPRRGVAGAPLLGLWEVRQLNAGLRSEGQRAPRQLSADIGEVTAVSRR